LDNLRSLINNKYHYKENKKSYNLMNNFYNSILFLKSELAEYENDLQNFNESINALILQLVLKDYNENKIKED